MEPVEFYTRKYFNLHMELHGKLGYDRRYVVKDITGELEEDCENYDEMVIHCILDELEDDN